jgi:MOSC domain-containing protein YiiM
MTLLSINVGTPREVIANGRSVTIGIFKRPIAGRVRVRSLNIDGDRQADLTVHGGIDKAVYTYPHEHYAHWERELGRHDFTLGQFGENLTTSGLLEDDVRIGDLFAIGSARFEVSQPRVPCFKLALRMEMPQFPKLLLKSQRTGFYLRVVQDGEIGAGDTISRVATDPQQMTVREVFDVAYGESSGRSATQRAMEMPALAASWREMFEERLAGE